MKSRLHVAHLAPYSVKFPLEHHNGRYDWVIDLARRQIAAGMDVTIYSNPMSHLDIPRISWKSIQDTYTDSATTNRELILQAFRNESIDVYHSHFDNLHYTLADATSKPIVFTQHWWPSDETIAKAQDCTNSNVWAVPPTHYMYTFDQENGIQTKGHIYHGIDLKKFHYLGEPKSDRLLFVGRVSPEKNLPTAIYAAQIANIPLDIIGKVAPKNQQYWDGLQPMIDGEKIRYLGPKPSNELVEYYNHAKAVIFPSGIHEPFGLVAIEAQACGAPVLMRQGGSRNELVDDGITGYLCDTDESFAAAVSKTQSLSPEACVAFAQHFAVEHMVTEYTNLYRELSRL